MLAGVHLRLWCCTTIRSSIVLAGWATALPVLRRHQQLCVGGCATVPLVLRRHLKQHSAGWLGSNTYRVVWTSTA